MKDLLLHLILTFCSFLVPKRKGLVLLGSNAGRSFSGNPKFIYLHLVRTGDPDFRPYWVTANKDLFNRLEQMGYPVLYRYSARAFWLFLRARHLVIAYGPDDVYYKANVLGRFSFIQLWHGSPLKYVGTQRDLAYGKGFRYKVFSTPWLNRWFIRLRILTQHRYKLISATSPHIHDILTRAFQNNRVQITGFARNDLFYWPELAFEAGHEKLGLSQFDAVWLYAPTFRDGYEETVPFKPEDWEALNTLMASKNAVFLVKKHPFENRIQVPVHLSHVRDVFNEVMDIQELLLVADGLISDYSSVYFDYCLRGKPIIFYTYDLEEYIANCRGLYDQPEEVLPGPFTRSADEVIRLIDTAETWFTEPVYQRRYSTFTDLYNTHKDGKSILRILEAMRAFR